MESSTVHDPRGYERYVEPTWRQVLRSGGRGADCVQRVPKLARGWRSKAPVPRGRGEPLALEPATCPICGPGVVEPVAVGEDFEYWTSPDSFLAVRCAACQLVFLDPRPAESELERIYPPDYHAFDFSAERYGLVYRVRRRLEARRMLRWSAGSSADATVLDVGCGDGFHLDLLRRFGPSGWKLVGVEPDERAAHAARQRGLEIHGTTVADAGITAATVDFAVLIQTIEHVPDPVELLREIGNLLKPGGRLAIVTDNVGSPDFRIFGGRHWGGYHFPRHWHLFERSTLEAAARAAGLDVIEITTIVSPVNWVYSLRNTLVDLGAPTWSYQWLSLQGAAGLAAGTVLDGMMSLAGRGALLQATLQRPAETAVS